MYSVIDIANKVMMMMMMMMMMMVVVMVMVLYCSGLGYIAGAQMAQAFGGWQWALRVSHLCPSII